ncbi:hypothetical protein ACQJBY_054946 [Aegilops geniculata]
MTGAKPLVLALSSPSSGSTEAADAAAVIAERFLPDLLYAAEKVRARTHDVPREDEEAKLSLMARVGKVLFQRWSTSREWFPRCLANALCRKMGSLQSTRKPLLLENLSPRLDGTRSMPNTGHTSHTHRYVLPLLHQCDFHQRKDHGMGTG